MITYYIEEFQPILQNSVDRRLEWKNRIFSFRKESGVFDIYQNIVFGIMIYVRY